jgi:hypothetical protein
MHCRARLGAPAPVWLAVTTIFVAERVVTVRARGPLQMALAAALRVQMPFDRFLQLVHAKANPRHVDKQRKEVVSMYHKAVLARTGAAAAAYPAATRCEVEGTQSLVSLQYPNGRIHETALIRARELRVGDQFELHGRQWRAVDSKQKRGRATKPRPRVLCVLATLPVQP